MTLTFATLVGWCEPLARALGGAARAPASSRAQAWQTGLSSEGSCGRRMSSFSSRWEGPDQPQFCFPQPPSSPCDFGVSEKPSLRRSWPMLRARRRDLLSSSSCLSSRQFGRWTRRWAPLLWEWRAVWASGRCCCWGRGAPSVGCSGRRRPPCPRACGSW